MTEAERITEAIAGFAADMRAAGIHVGMGATGRAHCVTCGEPWPCLATTAASDTAAATLSIDLGWDQ